jgi:hypothetical protein
MNSVGVLGGQRGDGGGGIPAQGGDGFDVRLNARAAARIRTGDDQNPSVHIRSRLGRFRGRQ